MSQIAILGYHKIGPPGPDGWETWFQIPERVFADHLVALREGGWQVLDADTFLAGLAHPKGLPERAALITFDDGYRSVRQSALSCLDAFGFPAVLFMPSDFVGRSNEFDRDNEPDEPLCDWDDLRELARSGVSIQSHGGSHRAFSGLSPAERRDELERSKAALESELGQPVELFAYPYGDDAGGVSDLRGALEQTGYQAAFGYGGGPFSLPVEDSYRLPRLPMGPDTDLRAVLAGIAGVDG
jgi:peptidoglycan/xylan/chitin deacetylase (PgdA/CDA1 family)